MAADADKAADACCWDALEASVPKDLIVKVWK